MPLLYLLFALAVIVLIIVVIKLIIKVIEVFVDTLESSMKNSSLNSSDGDLSYAENLGIITVGLLSMTVLYYLFT